jgi:hypothetical protein
MTIPARVGPKYWSRGRAEHQLRRDALYLRLTSSLAIEAAWHRAYGHCSGIKSSRCLALGQGDVEAEFIELAGETGGRIGPQGHDRQRSMTQESVREMAACCGSVSRWKARCVSRLPARHRPSAAMTRPRIYLPLRSPNRSVLG